MKLFLTIGALIWLLAGCQSLPSEAEGVASDSVFLSANHCLNEYLDDLEKNHYGPCLKVTAVNGAEPEVRPDGFLELPAATALNLSVSCVYRHADGTPIPATMETRDFAIRADNFPTAGERWYLHAHKQARYVVGCDPTLARSIYPTYDTD